MSEPRSRGPTRDTCPPRSHPEIDALIAEVLRAAKLDFADGRAEVEAELRAHFEDGLARDIPAQELIARFGDPVAAGMEIAKTRPRAAARRRGDTGRWWMTMGDWITEASRAIRRLRRAPGYAAIVIMTLALGVGVNTAIFSVLNAVVLEGLPYPEPERLVQIYESNGAWGEDGGDAWGTSEFLRAPTFAEWRTWDEIFASAAALYTYREIGADLTDGDVPTRITLVRASAGYFETLGYPPLFGRTFLEDESFGPGESGSTANPGAAVAVLSHHLWQERYGGDAYVVGRTIELDGSSFEVVGVMPAQFRDPIGVQGDVWVPQDLRPGSSNSYGNFYLTGVGRLRDGVTLESANQRLRTLALAHNEREPEMDGTAPELRPLQSEIVGETRRTMLWILAAAAGLVLLTACVNVANLLYARGLAQDRTLALRAALGSGRGRLIAGILMENTILALSSGVVGLGLGWLGMRALLGVAPDALPVVTEIHFGLPVFLFATAVTLTALLVSGLAPAVRMSRTAPAEVLRTGDRASTGGRLARRVRDGLVVAQLAAALVLVTGAALLSRSFDELLNVPLGVDEEGVVTFEVHLPSASYPEHEQRVRWHREFEDRIAALPGVRATGATSWLPVNGRYHTWGFNWDADQAEGQNEPGWHSTDVRVIEGDYFGVMGLTMLRGRSPSEIDIEGEDVAWINRHLAETVFAGVDPLGVSISLAGSDRRIVGIVDDVPHSTRGDISPRTYVPHAQETSRNWALIQTVKADGDPSGLQGGIREELTSIDPNLVLYRFRTFADVLDVARAQDRFATMLMAVFGVLALVLSLVGTYGVLASSVSARTREIGIRVALGADATSVRGMVLRYAAALTGPGIVLGLGLSIVVSRWLEALLFGVRASDPRAHLSAVLVFGSVALVAAWIPARRATRVDTVEVLSAE